MSDYAHEIELLVDSVIKLNADIITASVQLREMISRVNQLEDSVIVLIDELKTSSIYSAASS